MNKIKSKIIGFVTNVKNLFKWIPVFWQNPDLYQPNMHAADYRKIKEWIPTLLKDRDWDYGFMLEMEKQKLYDVIRWYEENDYGHHVCGWHDYRTLKWAYNCLNILLNNDWWTIKYPNEEAEKNWLHIPADEHMSYYVIKPYINTRNMKRFLPYYKNDEDYTNPSPYMKIDLREEKAWKLYHKIREQYMRGWWD